MKAKLLKEQMGVPAGTEMEVLETGRAWTLRAPSGNEIVVSSCDVEMVPDTEPLSEPKPLLLVTDEYQELLDEQRKSEVDPKDPSLLVNIFGGQPEDAVGSADATGGWEEQTELDDHLDAVLEESQRIASGEQPDEATPLHEVPLDPPVATDEDLDEALPEPQGGCDGEACEACQ